jgi:hypothetical protein
MVGKRVVLAVCTGRLGSAKMCSCRKQYMLVGCRYGLLVGDGVRRSGDLLWKRRWRQALRSLV